MTSANQLRTTGGCAFESDLSVPAAPVLRFERNAPLVVAVGLAAVAWESYIVRQLWAGSSNPLTQK
jgi:hypothetical protein